MTRARLGRLFRISLRTLLVVATLVCVLLGWKVRGVVRQRRAVAMVKASGFVEYDYERNPDYAGNLPGPDWLCQLVGVDYFAAVAKVVFHRVGDITPLAGLTQLEFLLLDSAEQSDLRIVASLMNLRVLALWEGDFTDLSPLANLSNLEELDLIDINVAEEEVTQLQRALPHCTVHRRESSRRVKKLRRVLQTVECVVS